MNGVEAKQANRFKFLHALYEKTDGSRDIDVLAEELGGELGFDTRLVDQITEYLVGEGLIEYVAMGPTVGLTHRGVVEVETALKNPQTPTHYFPPVVNILNVQTMVNSQIQQGSHGSTQSVSINQSQLTSIREFIGELRQRIPDLRLSSDIESEISSDASTVEVQLASSNPKKGIIRESLTSVRTILEGTAGNLLASELLAKLLPLLSSLP